jgi:hypothetical protein
LDKEEESVCVFVCARESDEEEQLQSN